MKRFAFVTFPSQELERPPAAAAAIQACVKKVGWECKVFDFNLHLNQHVTTDAWIEMESYWRCKSLSLSDQTTTELHNHIKNYIQLIKDYDADMIGISVFTRFSVVPAWMFLNFLHNQTRASIIMGGAGAYAWPGSLPALNSQNLSSDSATFAEMAQKLGYIDHYIVGDGEEAIIKLLQNEENIPGVNGIQSKQVMDLESLPNPDYTGIEPSNYFYTHKPGVYITATRGCVRRCTFCNIPEIWPKFRARSADDVVKEIITNKKKYNVDLFHFTDSLLNGNMKTWRSINEKLIQVKTKDSSLKDIAYMGQFICRPEIEQTERDWNLMAQAGAEILVTGFESYSEHVREHMGKKYSNSDIDFHFEQSALHGIKNVALMFVGYPVETLEDHEMNIEFLHRYQKYAKSGIIHMIRWGYTGMFREPEKVEKPGEVKLITDPDFAKRFSNLPQGLRDIALGFGWINELNPSLDLRERIRRRLEIHEISVKLGWPQTRNREELQILYNILYNYKNSTLDAKDFDELDTLLDFH